MLAANSDQTLYQIIIGAVALALGTFAAVAQETNAVQKAERLDAIAKSYTTDNAFMGAVLVAEGDRTLLDKGYGMADLEWSVPNTPDVKFRLGSLTKQFTAALVLLRTRWYLHVEDPIHKYLPDTPKSWEAITIADLLGHTSGIPNFTDDKAFATWSMSAHTHEEEFAFFREDKPLAFVPGSKFAYSNSNYEVLGTLIEKVTGRTYSDLLKERIFQPLEMVNSGLDTDELILPKRAQGYQPGEAGLVHARSESMTIPWVAGSIYSTAAIYCGGGSMGSWRQGRTKRH